VSLRAAVVGVGHLGSRHAEHLARSPHFRLTAVHDRRPEIATAAADRLGCPALSLDAALEAADVVVVATSTGSHRETAGAALDAGRHVLVEKPLTGVVADAEALVAKAERAGLVLQVGHVERFNPAVRSLFGAVPSPRFVESHRLAPLVARSLDIDVVQDLMIHDIDLALAFVGEEPSEVHASGVAVLTDRVDIANARLHFPGGAVANLTASRVSLDKTRKFRMFLPGEYISADLAARRARRYRLKPDTKALVSSMLGGSGPLEMLRFVDHQTVGDDADALAAEHEAFAAACRGEAGPGVAGRDVLAVLRTMVAVEEAIRRSAGAA